jgi:cation transport regulator
MAFQKLDDLPNEVKEKLPQGAQQVFLAAYKSASSDGISEDGAVKVAWNSVKRGYVEGADGQWHVKPEATSDNSSTGNMAAG